MYVPTPILRVGTDRRPPSQPTNGAEFLKPLMEDMVQPDVSKRPTIDEVVARFDELWRSLHWWQLRARLQFKDETDTFGVRPVLRMIHFFRTLGHILLFRNAIPSPKCQSVLR